MLLIGFRRILQYHSLGQICACIHIFNPPTVTRNERPYSPDGHVYLLVLNALHIEANGGDRLHKLVKVEPVLHAIGDKTRAHFNISTAARSRTNQPCKSF